MTTSARKMEVGIVVKDIVAGHFRSRRTSAGNIDAAGVGAWVPLWVDTSLRDRGHVRLITARAPLTTCQLFIARRRVHAMV